LGGSIRESKGYVVPAYEKVCVTYLHENAIQGDNIFSIQFYKEAVTIWWARGGAENFWLPGYINNLQVCHKYAVSFFFSMSSRITFVVLALCLVFTLAPWAANAHGRMVRYKIHPF
jgi:hypothetical protein